ncbi:hypothetical protein Tsp_04579 [Trichinella spiralis]|uniref:hypothetical protein n=1 Tax=Trichinella spiralis TaxID=6334 RepID=UPI0001EFD39B|nr:hypothetical protein Tsp_04579 [Trichinella spiralis]
MAVEEAPLRVAIRTFRAPTDLDNNDTVRGRTNNHRTMASALDPLAAELEDPLALATGKPSSSTHRNRCCFASRHSNKGCLYLRTVYGHLHLCQNDEDNYAFYDRTHRNENKHHPFRALYAACSTRFILVTHVNKTKITDHVTFVDCAEFFKQFAQNLTVNV